MCETKHTVIFSTSSNVRSVEIGLTEKEIDFYCRSYLEEDGGWIKITYIGENYKKCYEQGA